MHVARLENIDALRFFSFISVFSVHAIASKNAEVISDPFYIFLRKYVVSSGVLGVNFFFVLSGFLITYLLIQEYRKNSSIDFGKFYVRRVLRIWPLYYLVALIGYFGYHFVKQLLGEVSIETANPWLVFSFLNNFNAIENGHPISTVLAVLWSVAIEEQFYLFWPILFNLGMRLKILPYILFAVIATSTCWVYSIKHNGLLLEAHTFSCSTGLAIGALAAYFIIYSASFANFVRELSRFNIGLIYFTLALAWVFRYKILDSSFQFAYHLIYSCIFIFIILEQAFSVKSFFKLGNIPFVNYLGKISYGLYMLHMLAILFVAVIVRKIGLEGGLGSIIVFQFPLSLFLSILVSAFSFKYFEAYFLKRKNKYQVDY